jgi:hypothetical protein
VADRIGVRETCERCGGWVHCCRNCELYAPGLSNDCREPGAERVVDKEQGNFCDFFRLAGFVRSPERTAPGDARAQLEALFRKKSG